MDSTDVVLSELYLLSLVLIDRPGTLGEALELVISDAIPGITRVARELRAYMLNGRRPHRYLRRSAAAVAAEIKADVTMGEDSMLDLAEDLAYRRRAN